MCTDIEDVQLFLLSCWVLTRCFHFVTCLYLIFHGQIPLRLLLTYSGWKLCTAATGTLENGGQRSPCYFINLWFPEESGSCCSSADLRLVRPLMIKSVSQCFGGVSIVCICSVCVVCVFVWNEAKCLWTFTIDVLITVGWKTVTGEKRDIGYSHFICFRGGEKKICFLSAYLFILLIKHFKIVCLSENYISYFESYYLSYTNNIRMQVKATAETNSYPDADYPSSLLHCQGRDAFADCVFFFFLVKDHLLCKIFPPVAWKYPKKRYAK